MSDMLKTRACVERLRDEGYSVTEYALRHWVRTGAIPVRKVGNSFLLYYPNVVRYLQCADGCDNPALLVTGSGIRRVDLG